MSELEVAQTLLFVKSLGDSTDMGLGLERSSPESDDTIVSTSTLQTLQETAIPVDTTTKATTQVDTPTPTKDVKKKKYKCQECQKEFQQHAHLQIHFRKHTGERPFHCSFPNCFKSFSQLGNLKTHERKHTGEKPYQCQYCQKRFSQLGNMKTHQQLHLGIKSFVCQVEGCGKSFTQMGNLKSHTLKVHSGTPAKGRRGSTSNSTKDNGSKDSRTTKDKETSTTKEKKRKELQLLMDMKALIDKRVKVSGGTTD